MTPFTLEELQRQYDNFKRVSDRCAETADYNAFADLFTDDCVYLTSSPRLKPGDSNPFMLREQLFGGGAVIPRGFLLVPASVSLQHPRVLQLLGRR